MIINKLSVVIPVYNEEATIASILNKLIKVILIDKIGMEIIIVNDCSKDNTDSEIKRFIDDNNAFGYKILQT